TRGGRRRYKTAGAPRPLSRGRGDAIAGASRRATARGRRSGQMKSAISMPAPFPTLPRGHGGGRLAAPAASGWGLGGALRPDRLLLQSSGDDVTDEASPPPPY